MRSIVTDRRSLVETNAPRERVAEGRVRAGASRAAPAIQQSSDTTQRSSLLGEPHPDVFVSPYRYHPKIAQFRSLIPHGEAKRPPFPSSFGARPSSFGAQARGPTIHAVRGL